MKNHFFSPGKLLLTSEYVILDGAKGLALPTKWGQELETEEIEDGQHIIFWETYHQDKLWLKIKIDYSNWNIIETYLEDAAQFIVKVLKNCQEKSTIKFHKNDSYILKSNLQFPPDFGLGSSSTLLNNLADWTAVDAFWLNDASLGGSGYDIAVAQEKSPILFMKGESGNIIQPVTYNPSFKDDLLFVYLNQKQNSREGISLYRSKNKSETLIDQFTRITDKVLECNTIEEFSELMTLHEKELSHFLGIIPCKEKYFKNCPSFIKSLGAWGGDFILTSKFRDYQNYFLNLGYKYFFDYNFLIK